jgi:hypothetical protein
MDKYEKTLLLRYPELRQYHSLSGQTRANAVLGEDLRPTKLQSWIVELSSTLLWVTILLTFSAAGIALLIWAALRA